MPGRQNRVPTTYGTFSIVFHLSMSPHILFDVAQVPGIIQRIDSPPSVLHFSKQETFSETRLLSRHCKKINCYFSCSPPLVAGTQTTLYSAEPYLSVYPTLFRTTSSFPTTCVRAFLCASLLLFFAVLTISVVILTPINYLSESMDSRYH